MGIQDKPTCGPLFKKCLELFTRTATSPLELFAAGHLTGQAEKIYLNACPACMIRPSVEHRTWMIYVAARLSEIYGLEVSVFVRPEIADEIWLHRPTHREAVAALGAGEFEFESEGWHTLRGLLCGIPLDEIDSMFHEREGYRQPCDRLNAEGSVE